MGSLDIRAALQNLPNLDSNGPEIWDVFRWARIYAKTNTDIGGPCLALILEYLIRTNAKAASVASIELLYALESNLLPIKTVMGILERWEKHPVDTIDPNLGASIYEHLIADERYSKDFNVWRNDSALRKRVIEVGYALAMKEEIELYEWALKLGETEAVAESLSVFGSKRTIKSKSYQKRWKAVLNEISKQVPASK